MVDYVRKWSQKTEVTVGQIQKWIGIWSSTYCSWTKNYGRAFEHNGWIPRDHWLDEWEKQAILQFHFDQPLVAHEHWHIDISYLNIAGTFYFMATILDGFSRSIVHWDIREKMEEVDIEIIIQVGREKYPGVTPRIISDNGPQFIAKDFKHFIRLHSAIGYVTPLAMLEGRQQAIFDERDRKLEEARELRAKTRAAKSSGKSKNSLSNQEPTAYLNSVVAEDRALPGCLPSAAAMPLTEACAGRI